MIRAGLVGVAVVIGAAGCHVEATDGAVADAGQFGIADAGNNVFVDAGSGTDAPIGLEYCYDEPLNPNADISDIVAGFGGASYKDQIIAAVGRVWPGGTGLLEATRDNENFARFSDQSSWAATANDLDFLTHEMTHIFNFDWAFDNSLGHALYMHKDSILPLPASSEGFSRSEIVPYMAPFAAAGQYGQLYFQNEQGTRGFTALLDELSCYTAELAISSVYDAYFDGFGISLRDGSVAFLYFMQLYLRVARLDHETYYQTIKADPAVVTAVRDSWLRVHHYLSVADSYPRLGIDDAQYRQEMYKAENLAEIELFIGDAVGDSNCLNP